MTYLVCKNCGGYYELPKGDSPSNYDKCDCGGELVAVENLNEFSFRRINNRRNLISVIFNINPRSSYLPDPKHNLLFNIGVVLTFAGLLGFFMTVFISAFFRIYPSSNGSTALFTLFFVLMIAVGGLIISRCYDSPKQ